MLAYLLSKQVVMYTEKQKYEYSLPFSYVAGPDRIRSDVSYHLGT